MGDSAADFFNWSDPLSCNISMVAMEGMTEGRWLQRLMDIVYPFFMVLGMLGNVASILVCQSPRLRRVPSSQHLTALASYDTLVLLLSSLEYIETLYVVPIQQFPIVCPLFRYLLYVSMCLSSWSVSVFTVERFVVVYYPLQRAQICTVEKARGIIVGLIPVAMVTFSPVLWMHGMSCGYCDLERAYDTWGQALNVVDTVLSAVLPSLLVIVLNTLIVARLYRSRDVPGSAQGRGPSSQSREQGVTKMLLIISSSFVILNVPSYAIRLKVLMTRVLNMPQLWTPLDQDLEYIFYMMFLLNFSIDFVMYNLSSRHFRQLAAEYFGRVLWRLCPWLPGTPPSSRAATTQLTSAASTRSRHSIPPSKNSTVAIPLATATAVPGNSSAGRLLPAAASHGPDAPAAHHPLLSKRSHTIITRI